MTWKTALSVLDLVIALCSMALAVIILWEHWGESSHLAIGASMGCAAFAWTRLEDSGRLNREHKDRDDG